MSKTYSSDTRGDKCGHNSSGKACRKVITRKTQEIMRLITGLMPQGGFRDGSVHFKGISKSKIRAQAVLKKKN
jgi:hypothetical protein